MVCHSEMKIYEHMTIIFTLSLMIRGMTVTHVSLLEGEPFTFHLPDLLHGPDIALVEWKEERNRSIMLAIINLDNSKIDTFAPRSRFNFTTNGSFHITDVQQEDVGNYTYKIIFKNGTTKTRMVTLTLTSETSQQGPVHNSTNTSLVHQPAIVTQIVMPVGLGVSGLVLLVGVVLIIIKCRKKPTPPEQSIYVNLDYTKKEDPKRKRKRKT